MGGADFLTSVLSDVSHPWQGLVPALLNDLQVAHLKDDAGVLRSEGHISWPSGLIWACLLWILNKVTPDRE